ncbi:hypothetical protein GCM10011297_02680 [Bacterioplanes sanyensis]|uniref:glucosaminidase domain-containing protein n=1 Tax=Bacterioplanes sanyensis TaxID=1249553 RepID=UPI0016794A9D|nr:glucosaminidase domain-containing protein [Bacterioplanes sanyensis]GGY33187.1 hypothetical protein GCM10011297_02680 [Bacterioplanes sanyensis]
MRTLAGLTLCLGLLSGCNEAPPESTTSSPPAPTPLPDFTDFDDVERKKQAFFDYLLPMIEQVNEEVLAQRQQVESMQEPFSAAQQQQLQQLSTYYRIKASEPEKQRQSLLRRLLPLPPSLVLAQAANESAWGTSRFATEGNNLFGQWCFSQGCGLVPLQRPEGDIHEVAVFESPLASVRSYVRNLNSHPQYQLLRRLRWQQWQQQGYAEGRHLAAGLLGYSERREEYVHEIRNMISYNELDQYDHPEGESSMLQPDAQVSISDANTPEPSPQG